MKLVSAMLLAGAVAAGYTGARRLLDHPEMIDRLPAPARRPALQLRARLELARVRAQAVLAEVERGRREAEAELMRDYYQRVGRPIDGSPPAP